jgi:hypothetical protein
MAQAVAGPQERLIEVEAAEDAASVETALAGLTLLSRQEWTRR